ncbi:hypothetical protein RvY_09635 [Ramazzottius varieornatus]|uniref:Uncharacterized protein n=1 Tax=Ramazzottius varieornatus TaxID=947166 RepID=A0A1D1VFF9_RAMVA|nr:hypothetical protein RvY_09635 [Ramazzottius varieornatus]
MRKRFMGNYALDRSMFKKSSGALKSSDMLFLFVVTDVGFLEAQNKCWASSQWVLCICHVAYDRVGIMGALLQLSKLEIIAG